MKKYQGSSPLKFIPQAAQALGAVAKIGIGLAGRKKKKDALKKAQGAYDMQRQAFENMDTSNLYMDQENVYEDMTVNTQQADFAKAQAMQSQANIMDQFGQAAGGSGIAALAQAMAGQSAQQAQQASLDIGQQERANQMSERNMAATIQQNQISGEYDKRQNELGKIDTMMQLTGQDLQAAQAEKSASDQMLLSGIGDAAGQLVPNLGKFNPFKKK
tara:strand:- start:7552 stop:8199 length:648 start_codon:yes stop_codon:yes gene_type:complete